jgi:hypothetical protein
MPPFRVAQSLLDYDVLNTLSSKLTTITYAVQDWFRRQEHPQLILALGTVVFLLLVARSFRPHGR